MHIPLQGKPESAEQNHLVADAVFLHGLRLAALKGDKALQAGKALQQRGLLHQIVRLLTEILRSLCRVFVGAGDQQRVQLGLGWGNGNHLDNVFSFGICLHRGIAANAIMVVDGVTHGEAVQQGRDGKLFRQVNRLLYPLYHK